MLTNSIFVGLGRGYFSFPEPLANSFIDTNKLFCLLYDTLSVSPSSTRNRQCQHQHPYTVFAPKQLRQLGDLMTSSECFFVSHLYRHPTVQCAHEMLLQNTQPGATRPPPKRVSHKRIFSARFMHYATCCTYQHHHHRQTRGMSVLLLLVGAQIRFRTHSSRIYGSLRTGTGLGGVVWGSGWLIQAVVVDMRKHIV